MKLTLRRMTADEWPKVAALIHASINAWYVRDGKGAKFTCDPAECEVFCRTYETLDPGCCVVAVDEATGRIAGSCFYHPRPTHISIGIVNVDPAYFGQGVGRQMLGEVVALSERERKPLRLVSSAMNLDSFSLYTRAGFVPRMTFQDMLVPSVPEGGLPPTGPDDVRVRPAVPADVPAMAALEREISGIERTNDFRHFIENRDNIWHVSVLPSATGGDGLDGFLASIRHPASNMLGPGVARTASQAAALIRAELNRRPPGKTPVFLVPVDAAELVRQVYAWGGRNCEMHVAQVRPVSGASDDWTPPRGIVMPTFLPETG